MRKDGLTSWDALKAKIERKNQLLKQAEEILNMILDLYEPTAFELFGYQKTREILSLDEKISAEIKQDEK